MDLVILQIFICYKDHSLPNAGKTYYDCNWIQFMEDNRLRLYECHQGSDVLQRSIDMKDVDYFDIFVKTDKRKIVPKGMSTKPCS